MGFFSKIWKSVKKGFKAVFKPIKQVFKTVGKFMNKIGIVGQIALMFIPIPGLGAFMSMLGRGAKAVSGFLGTFSNVVAQSAKFVLDGAITVGTKIGQGFKTITEGVKTFIGNTTKYLVNKIPGITITSAPTSFFGPGSESVLGRTSANISTNFNALMAPTTAPVTAAPGRNPDPQASVELNQQPVLPDASTPVDLNLDSASQPFDMQTAGQSEFVAPTLDIGTAPPPSLLDRAGTYIQEAPGKFKNYVVNDLPTKAGNFALALPEKILEKAVVTKGYEWAMGDETPEYETQRSGYGQISTSTQNTYDSDMLANSMRQQSPLQSFANFMYQPMMAATNEQGTWAMNLQARTG